MPETVCGAFGSDSVLGANQRNSREENQRIQQGETPEEWSAAKREQQDVQARWTRKHGESFFGHKNHIGVDAQHKLIRSFTVTPANVH